MLSIGISLLIGLGLGCALIEGFDLFEDTSRDDADTIPEPTDNPDMPDMLDTIFVSSGETVAGSDADDQFALVEGDVYFGTPVSVSGGDGDDVLDLTDPTGADAGFGSDYLLGQSEISGGAGNDVISVAATYSTITGDDGDDVISIDIAAGSSVFGGAGDDLITGIQSSSDSALLDGGDGNDTLDGRLMENTALRGGAGDDTILISGYDQPGAGYVVRADGGDGDDLIRFDGTALADPGILATQTALGGAGSDTFALRFSEGGALGDALVGDEPARLDVITLGDFTPGQDTIEVETYRTDTGFSIASARLSENLDAGTTELVISYTHPTDTDRDVIVKIDAVGLEWGDISFIGDNTPAVIVPII